MILALRTDKPLAELYLAENKTITKENSWEAHRQLADTIHIKIAELLQSNSADWHDITGLVVYKGPGSFTGLRISITVANTLASTMKIPIVGSQGDEWLHNGLVALLGGKNDKIVLPEYGGTIHITAPKK